MKLLNLIFELGLATDFRNKDCHRWGGKWILHEDITSNEKLSGSAALVT